MKGMIFDLSSIFDKNLINCAIFVQTLCELCAIGFFFYAKI